MLSLVRVLKLSRLIIVIFKKIVGGGTGFIGSHLCNLLRSKGYTITIISRMPGPQRISWQELRSAGLPEDTTTVVNLAGQNVLDLKQRWNAGFKQNIWNSRVNTTETLAKAITNAKKRPKVFLTISGVGIYKPSKKDEYTEESTIVEYDFLSKLCCEWEKAAKLPSDLNVRQVTVRSGVVLAKDGGMIKQLYLPFYLGLGGPIMPGDQYLPWIHMSDLTRLIMFAIENDEISGILNGVAPNTITNRDFSNVRNPINVTEIKHSIDDTLL